MKTTTFKMVLATAATAIAAAVGSALPAQARLPETVEHNAPQPYNETIYRPICWTEDGYERWLRCVAAPGEIENHHPRIRGGYRGP